jgi:hypothetical protein
MCGLVEARHVSAKKSLKAVCRIERVAVLPAVLSDAGDDTRAVQPRRRGRPKLDGTPRVPATLDVGSASGPGRGNAALCCVGSAERQIGRVYPSSY